MCCIFVNETVTTGISTSLFVGSVRCVYETGQAVDVALVEVGLGGRLDATNVVDPLAAAVTQIGFDHMEFLGSTLDAIAGEKAGIFKPNRPALVGEQRSEIRDLLARHAVAAGSSAVLVTGRDWVVSEISVDAPGTSFTLEVAGRRRRLTTPLVGQFQAHNAAVALGMLRAAGARIARRTAASMSARWTSFSTALPLRRQVLRLCAPRRSCWTG